MDWHNYIELTPGFFISWLVIGFVVAGTCYASVKDLFLKFHNKCDTAKILTMEDCPVCRKGLFATIVAIIILWPLVVASKMTG